MTRVVRIVSVSLGLIGAGFIFGALAGGAAFSTVLLMDGEGISLGAFGIGAIYGAPLGAVTAPLFSWLLLRHAPLGKVFLVCSVGTAIGGIIGWFSTSTGDIVLNSLASAFIGCLIAAVALRYRVQHA